ncbi:MAG: pyridoxal phosphate-dependent aminotransferase [Chloroflexota bacterium]|nr:pyridoxal phosphate-dependent aminotransferase [Chloroflexota bacterium]
MSVAAKIQRAMASQSWIRQMFELGIQLKQEHGDENVFDLSLGNPILEPPEEVAEALKRLASDPPAGMHRYMPNAGYAETRAAIAAHLASQTGLPFMAAHTVMTCGAGGALNIIFKSILNPGEEVIIFAPFFPEYPFYADNHGATTTVAPTDEAFCPDLDALAPMLSARTKAVLVNSPNNPSGALYPADLLGQLGGLLARAEAEFGTSIYLISDEPYSQLTYDGLETPPIFHAHARSILATSFSKNLALPGERIGYVAVNPGCPDAGPLVDALTYCNRVLGFVNAPALMQWLVRDALTASVDVGWYARKRDFLYNELTGMGYSMVKPQGAFYAFPASPNPDDVAFVKELLQWNVLVTPGTGFGSPGFFRISFCLEDRVLEGAMHGFREAIAAYR